MGERKAKLNMYEPAVFRLCIQCELDDSWFNYFNIKSITTEQDQAGNAVTVMVSAPMDQAALVGLINHLNALAIPLISVEPVLEQ